MVDPALDKFRGCLLGLALGDAHGAPLEGGFLERLIWSLIGRTRDGRRRWTDDTQMSLDLAESLVARRCLDLDDVAARFARSYRWSRGYGPGAAKLLKRLRRGESWRDANRSVFREGSYGNGGAMRAPVMGLFCWKRPEELPQLSMESASITHAHPLGREGAVLVATATAAALECNDPSAVFDSAASNCSLPPFVQKLQLARGWIDSDQPPQEISRRLGNGIAAADSCVTALYIAVRFCRQPFEKMCGFVAECGGDTDTIGAMAGAIWGAANGKQLLPEADVENLEESGRIQAVAEGLYRVAG